MATSGSYNFNLDVGDIVEEAFDQIGLELRTSHDLITARRSLDLLLTEWSNYQVNLWKIEQKTIALVDGTATYTVNDPVIDILDGVVRDSNNNDVPAERISFQEYLNLTSKTTEGRPTQYSVLRQRGSLSVSFWNTPDQSYTFVYYALQYIEDIGALNSNTIDMPRRFLPALVAGLAYKLAMKFPAKFQIDSSGKTVQVDGVDAQRRRELEVMYERLFEKARDEDRERASLMIKPRIRRI